MLIHVLVFYSFSFESSLYLPNRHKVYHIKLITYENLMDA